MTDKNDKQCVLVVDDTPENIDVIKGVLGDCYRLKVALNGLKALKIAEADPPPDLILLDIMMPEMDGYEVCRRLKENPITRRIPIIFLTAKNQIEDEARGFQLGAVDYITKPISPPIVQARVRTQLALYDQNRTLEEKVVQRTAELNSTRLEIIRRLGRAAEFKDNETGLHVIRMSKYSQLLGLAAGIDDIEADILLNASPMHDIGKIGTPDSILRKPARLDDDERKEMEKHTIIGASIIGKHETPLLAMARRVALTHHEKWDGSGYPNGLAAEDIPLEGRIVAIADVFDALTSERPYKNAWPVEKATNLIQEESGTHFDPGLTPRFLEIIPEVLKVKQEFSENYKPDDD